MNNPNCGMCGNLNHRGFCNLTTCLFPAYRTEKLNIKITNYDKLKTMTPESIAYELAEKYWTIEELYKWLMEEIKQ